MSTTNPMDALIDQMAGDNEQLKTFVQIMRQQQAEEEEALEEEIPYEEVVQDSTLKKALIKEQKKSRKFIQLFKMQQQELNFLDGISEELAAALGACSSCWGQEDDCEYCRGNGIPGFYPPEKKAFNEWVSPALRVAPWRKKTRNQRKMPSD